MPKNYNALELNDARINWFNPNANYNQVVIAAANEASGQGFVTEYAQPGSSLAGQLWTAAEQANWQRLKAAPASSETVTEAMFMFSQWEKSKAARTSTRSSSAQFPATNTAAMTASSTPALRPSSRAYSRELTPKASNQVPARLAAPRS